MSALPVPRVLPPRSRFVLKEVGIENGVSRSEKVSHEHKILIGWRKIERAFRALSA
jgi:hypothetical protein